MKKILLLVATLIAGACATSHTMESVAGEYMLKKGKDVYKWVFLGDGVVAGYKNGKKTTEDKWSLMTEIHPIKQHSLFGKVIHIKRADDSTEIARINPDGSITFIAQIDKNGKRMGTEDNKRATFIKNANKPSAPPLIPSIKKSPTKGENSSAPKKKTSSK